MKHSKINSILFILFSAVAAADDLDLSQLYRDYAGFRYTNNDIAPHEIANQNKNITFILIKGWGGENINSYFNSMRNRLNTLIKTDKTRGDRNLFVFSLNSFKSYEWNSDLIASKIRAVDNSSTPNTKYVLLGHSMGGVALWTFAMQNPDFIESKVKAAIFLQSPFGGSPLAKHLHERKPLSDLGTFFENPLSLITRWGVAKSIAKYYDSLPSLLPETSNLHVSRILEKYGSQYDSRISSKFGYIGTYQDPVSGHRALNPKINPVMNLCNWSMAKLGFPKNDGVVDLASTVPDALLQNRAAIWSNLNHISLIKTSDGSSFAKALFRASQRGQK